MDKELMDCLLSDNEIYRSFRVSEDAISLMANPSASRESNYRCIAKAQLQSPKLKAYISEQKRDVIKALGQYEMGVISTEECAKRIGITTVEFNDSYYGGE